MRVSIVTISFNQATFLEAAIRSVIDQDYADIEYIIVDPGSTDDSREIIDRYRNSFAQVIFDRDAGPADGLNKGFAQATGDIFAYINADDALLTGAVGKAVAEFERHPDADVIYGHGYLIDEAGHVLRRLRSAPYNLRRALCGASIVVQQATFIRRDAFRAVGGFNARNMSCWDYELVLDLARAGKRFRRVDQYWGLFRLHPQSITGSRRLRDEISRDDARIFAKVTGHPWGRWSKLKIALARLEKWLVDPRSLMISLVDTLRGGRRP